MPAPSAAGTPRLEPDIRLGPPSVGVDWTLDLRLGADPLASLNHVVAQASRFPYTLPTEFRRALRALVRANRAELAPLDALTTAEPGGGAPCFLGTLGRPGVHTLASQLEQLSDWTGGEIRAELSRVCAEDPPPAQLRPWLRQPRRARDDYVRAVRVFEERVFSTLFPHHVQRQRREAERWATAAAMASTATLVSMLTTANPNLALVAGQLRLRAIGVMADGQPSKIDRPIPRTLWLFPTVGGERTVRHSDAGESDADMDYVAFATPGLRIPEDRPISGRETAVASSALVSVLGPVHAAIVEQLGRRAVSTTELAALIDRAPSTTSAHLTNLCGRGLIAKRRCGAVVQYELTELGDRLVTALRT